MPYRPVPGRRRSSRADAARTTSTAPRTRDTAAARRPLCPAPPARPRRAPLRRGMTHRSPANGILPTTSTDATVPSAPTHAPGAAHPATDHRSRRTPTSATPHDAPVTGRRNPRHRVHRAAPRPRTVGQRIPPTTGRAPASTSTPRLRADRGRAHRRRDTTHRSLAHGVLAAVGGAPPPRTIGGSRGSPAPREPASAPGGRRKPRRASGGQAPHRRRRRVVPAGPDAGRQAAAVPRSAPALRRGRSG